MKHALVVTALLCTLGLVGCGPVQSPECAQYIQCQTDIDAEQGTSTAEQQEEAYGETGTCWSTNAEAAQACTAACVDALEGLGTSYPEIDSCQLAAAEG